MTVAELIEVLQKQPSEAEVLLVDNEYGNSYPIEDVHFYEYSGAVEIE